MSIFNSDNMMKLLLIAYIIILSTTLCEKNWKLALYWLGACILQISVIIGMKK